MSGEPTRLIDELDSSDAERALLAVGRGTPPVDYDVERGASRFRAGLAALAVGAAASTAAGPARGALGAARRALLGKLGVKLLIGIVLPFAGLATAVRFAPRPGAQRAAPVAVAARSTGLHEPPAAAATEPPLATVPRESEPEEARPAVRAQDEMTATTRATSPSRAMQTRATPVASSHRAAQAVTVHLDDEAPTPGGTRPGGATPETAAPRSAAETSTETRATPTALGRQAEPRVEPSATPERDEPAPRRTAPAVEPSGAAVEMRAIAEARALLAKNPGAALAALQKLGKEHPRGYFVEERRALVIFALARTGQNDAARKQASSFLHEYPNSPFADRIRPLATP